MSLVPGELDEHIGPSGESKTKRFMRFLKEQSDEGAIFNTKAQSMI